jgi:hypothetical protein
MRSRIPRNILLPLTKTWNTYSLGRCGSYLPQVHPMGIGTTLCRTRSAVFECCTWKGLEQRKAEEGRKKGNQGGGVRRI